MMISEIDIRYMKMLAERILNLIESIKSTKISLPPLDEQVLDQHRTNDDTDSESDNPAYRFPDRREKILDRINHIRGPLGCEFDLLEDAIARYLIFVPSCLELFRKHNVRDGIQYEYPGCRHTLTRFELLPAVGNRFALAIAAVQPQEATCDECLFWRNRLESVRRSLKELPEMDLNQWRVDVEREFFKVLENCKGEDWDRELEIKHRLAVPEQLETLSKAVGEFGKSYQRTLVRLHPLLLTGEGPGLGLIERWHVAEKHSKPDLANDLERVRDTLVQLYFGVNHSEQLNGSEMREQLLSLAVQIKSHQTGSENAAARIEASLAPYYEIAKKDPAEVKPSTKLRDYVAIRYFEMDGSKAERIEQLEPLLSELGLSKQKVNSMVRQASKNGILKSTVRKSNS